VKLEWTPGRKRAAVVGTWSLATALLAICAWSIDWSHAAEVLTTARPSWIVIAILLNAAIVPLTAAYWLALRPHGEPPVSFRRSFEIAATAIALMNTVPFGAGHASVVVLWVRRGNTSQRAALSILALDQLGEGITKVGLFLIVALVAPMPAWMRAAVTTVTLLVAILFVALAVASRWASELRIDRSWVRASGGLAFVIGTKLAEGLAIVAVQRAFGIDVGANGTMLVLAAVILGSMIPITPGNAGTYDAAAFVAYGHLGLTPEQSLSLAFVQHVCFVLPSVGIGYLFVSAQTFARNAMASR
jgi:glycosyltransferase 2 family protein